MTIQAVEKSVLHIPDHTGDSRIMWDPRVQDEIDTAKAAFDAAKAKGMTAYAVNADGSKNDGTIIREFDPNAGKIIMVKQIVGG